MKKKIAQKQISIHNQFLFLQKQPVKKKEKEKNQVLKPDFLFLKKNWFIPVMHPVLLLSPVLPA
jgi:hypothetical protein